MSVESRFEIHEQALPVLFPLPKERYPDFLRLLEEFPRPEDGEIGMSADMKHTLLQDMEKSDLVVGVDAGGELVAAETGDMRNDKLFLNHAVVDSRYRGAGLLSKMEQTLIEKAREKGCRYVVANISLFNVFSLVAHFKEGFIAYAHSWGVNDFIKVAKEINVKDQESLLLEGEPIEVPLAEFEDIQKYFAQGYVGVDLKNVSIQSGEQAVNDERDQGIDNWTMVMRKATPIFS